MPCGGMPLRGGAGIPFQCFRQILDHACAGGVTRGQIVLRVRMPLLGGFSIPKRGFLIILRHAVAVAVHQPCHKLRFGLPLSGGFFIPVQSLLRAGRHAQAVLIQHRQIVLRRGIALLRQRLQQADDRGEILFLISGGGLCIFRFVCGNRRLRHGKSAGCLRQNPETLLP